MKTFTLVTLDPAHFHAALIQKQPLAELARDVHVYAPPGPDLDAHLARIDGFNSRAEEPANWRVHVHATADFWERLLKEKPGDIVVLSGRNHAKCARIAALARAGLHVLADKPWIIDGADMATLEDALESAARSGVAVFDAMTERFEITHLVMRELVNDPEIFGRPLQVRIESLHHLLKLVAGKPNLRPAAFFDVGQQGEGLTDVGTHLVDLVQWTLFPEQAIDWRKDIRLSGARRWPTVLTAEQYERVTGTPLGRAALEYYCNNRVDYEIRGVAVRLDVEWDYEAPPGGGDWIVARYTGSRTTVELRGGEVRVLGPVEGLAEAVNRRLEAMSPRWPGLSAEAEDGGMHVVIPDRYRVGHEAHFTMLVRQFLNYVKDPKSMPDWERPNMLAKYHVTTGAVAMARSAVALGLTAVARNSGFPDGHDTYNGMLAASDGRVYYVLCSEKAEVAARMFSFDPARETIRFLGDLTTACGEHTRRAVAQGKSHVNFVESQGKLYFATHTGYYQTIDGMEKPGIPPPGCAPYPGGHLLAYDMSAGTFEDLAVEPGGDGILTFNMDVDRGRLYGLTWPTGRFFRFDLAGREWRDFGSLFREGEHGKGNAYRTICRSLAVDPRDGAVYFTTGEGDLFRYDYGRDALEPFPGVSMRRDYFGHYDPSSPGHMAYNWRQVVWRPRDEAFYGVHGNSGYLFRFDPMSATLDLIDRITSSPSRRTGMFDQFSYGYLGFTLGPDGDTLYYLTGGPVFVGGRRLEGKASTAKGEAKGEENLHLVTWHIPTGRYTDHGPVFYPNGDRPSYVNSIAVDPSGGVHTLARVTRGGATRTDLVSIRIGRREESRVSGSGTAANLLA